MYQLNRPENKIINIDLTNLYYLKLYLTFKIILTLIIILRTLKYIILKKFDRFNQNMIHKTYLSNEITSCEKNTYIIFYLFNNIKIV